MMGEAGARDEGMRQTDRRVSFSGIFCSLRSFLTSDDRKHQNTAHHIMTSPDDEDYDVVAKTTSPQTKQTR